MDADITYKVIKFYVIAPRVESTMVHRPTDRQTDGRTRRHDIVRRARRGNCFAAHKAWHETRPRLTLHFHLHTLSSDADNYSGVRRLFIADVFLATRPCKPGRLMFCWCFFLSFLRPAWRPIISGRAALIFTNFSGLVALWL